MVVNPGVDLDILFALPHAISLAEAGKTIQDKRIGIYFARYSHCAMNHFIRISILRWIDAQAPWTSADAR